MKEAGGVFHRTLRAADIPAAMQLSSEAGWNQTEDDWRMLIELSPQGCLALEMDGDVVATTTLLCYGNRLAWIGMVLTKMTYRGRGFARQLLTEALSIADRRQIETVKLDATDQGQPLYERLGFRPEKTIERWMRSGNVGPPAPESRVRLNSSVQWQDTDTAAFGAERKEVLSRLAERHAPLSQLHSYLMTRNGRVSRYLGPCVAESPSVARSLIVNALQTSSPEGWAWDLFPSNAIATTIAKEFSFSPQRHLMRMVRGKDLCDQENRIYAIAGFELG